MTATKLNPRHASFIAEYLKDKNATQAAVRAGYAEKSAKYTARELLKTPHIKAAVARALKEQEKRTLIAADQVLLDIQQGGDDARKVGEFHAFLRSRELLGKHFKLFADKVEITGKDGGPIVHRSVSDLTDEELAAIALGKTA
jgi:phage terminase small subunit